MCYELTVSSRKQLEHANLRAQARKPKIEMVGYGMYKVFSTNPETPFLTYATGIERARDGKSYDVCCSCPTQKTFCLHVAAIFGHFLMVERQHAEADLPGFSSQIQEIRDICAATAATLAGYTAEMAAKDRSDLFG